MADAPRSSNLSRRQWLGAAAPALVASAAILPLRAARAETAAPAVAGGDDAGTRVYNIRAFGAKGDGVTLDTAALQAAIDACARDGGGTVLVPAGTFPIGTTELKSNVTLHLAASALLQGSGDGKQYHAVDAIPLSGDSTLGDGNWALLFAVNAKNTTVEGAGTIDGQGAEFFSYSKATEPPRSGLKGPQRPYHLLFHRCENLVVRDIRLIRCAFHSIRVIQSEQVRMEGLYIHNRVNTNNDGFHFVSAKHVLISNCTVLCQDDACALFGSCQFVTVTNCTFSTRWSVFRFGGGQVKNITVSNCLIYETYGCPIKIGASGSQIENLSFSNIIFDRVTGPIGINFTNRGRANSETPPRDVPPSFVRNLSFNHIRVRTVTEPVDSYGDMATLGTIYDGEQNSCITLNGIGSAVIENVSFDDVHVISAGGGTAEHAAKRKIPETTREYFGMWAEAPFGPPAYGMYVRNVRGLTLNNVRFEVASPDLRPAIVFDNVQDASLRGLSLQGNPEGESVLRFTRVRDVLVSASRVISAAGAFLQLEGDQNSGITLEGGDLTKARIPLAFRDGATDAAVRRA